MTGLGALGNPSCDPSRFCGSQSQVTVEEIQEPATVDEALRFGGPPDSLTCEPKTPGKRNT